MQVKLSARTRFLNYFRRIFMNPIGESFLAAAMMNTFTEPLAFKLLPNHYQYKKTSLRNVKRNDINYLLDISNLNDWEVYFNATEKTLGAFIDFCKPGSVVFDVGANIGYSALSFAKHSGTTGKVFAFEPFPFTFSKLQKNCSLNSFPQLHIYPLAIAAQAGPTHVQVVTENNLGKNKIDTHNKENQSQPVNGTSLDLFYAAQTLSKIDLIKIDVEGYELEVLKGATVTMRSFGPTLFVEVDDENLRAQDTTPAELIRLLHSEGYRLFEARTQQPVSLGQDFTDCHFDIWCRKET